MDAPDFQTRVYRYRCLGDLPQPALDEMRRGHELSNRMVEVERRHEERIKDVWRQAPTLQALETEVTELEEKAEEVAERVKRARQRSRSTEVPAELKDELKAVRKKRATAKAALRDEKARIYPLLKPDIVAAGEARKAAIKALYAPAIADGLYWANFNFVRDRHEAAVKAVRGRRKMGLPSSLRFRRWNGGEGTLAVQLQRQISTDPRQAQLVRSPTLIADPAGRFRNVMHLTPALDPADWATRTRAQQRKIRLGTIRFRIGSGDAAGHVQMPIIIHRPLPPDADICFVEIKRIRLGSRFQTFVSVVVRLPVVPQRTSGPRVAMHVGWRSLGDRSLRVGVVTGVRSAPPPDLHDVVRFHDDWAEIVVPAWYRDQMDHVHRLSSIRSKSLDVMKTWLLKWIDDHPDHDLVGIDMIDRWRSADRFGHLIGFVLNDKLGDDELREYLNAWWVQDVHVRDEEDNLRAKIIARRNNAFCNVAAWLLADAALLVIDNYNIANIARRPNLTEPDLVAHRVARANRVLAAPGRLRGAMVDAAARRGVHVQTVDGTISKIHAVCGSDFEPTEREANVMVHCPKCQTMVDQDANALDLLRGRAVDLDGDL
jgi:hypothetical protein